MDTGRQAGLSRRASSAWYVVMHGNDMTLRVHDRMTLGEDAGGILRYDSRDPAEQLVRLEFSDRGALVARMLSDTVTWADAPGVWERTLEPGTCLRLPNNEVCLNDSLDASASTGPVYTLVEDPHANAPSLDAADESAGAPASNANMQARADPSTARIVDVTLPESSRDTIPAPTAVRPGPRPGGAVRTTAKSRKRRSAPRRGRTLLVVVACAMALLALVLFVPSWKQPVQELATGVSVSGTPASGAPASGAPASGAPASGTPASSALAPDPSTPIAPPPETAVDHARHDEFVQNLFALLESTPASDGATLAFLERSFRTVLDQSPGNVEALAGLRMLADKRALSIAADTRDADPDDNALPDEPAPTPGDEAAGNGAVAGSAVTTASASERLPARAQDQPATADVRGSSPIGDEGSDDAAPAAASAAASDMAPNTTAKPRASSAAVVAAIKDARDYMALGYLTAPPGTNAVTLLQRALREDPANVQAQALLAECADRMAEAAVDARAAGLDFEARNLVEEVLAFQPQHARAQALWRNWTDGHAAVWDGTSSDGR